MLAFIVFLLLIIIVLEVMLIVVGFKQRIFWGIGLSACFLYSYVESYFQFQNLFQPSVQVETGLTLLLSIISGVFPLVFIILNWRKTWKIFASMIAVVVMIYFASYSLAKDISKEMIASGAMQTIAEKIQKGEVSEEEGGKLIIIEMLETAGLPIPESLRPETEEVIEDETIAPEDAPVEEGIEGGVGVDAESQQPEAEPELQKIIVFNKIKLSQAPKYIGEKLRVESKTGILREGKLISVNPLSIVLELKVSGGKFSFEIFNEDIKVIKVREVEFL